MVIFQFIPTTVIMLTTLCKFCSFFVTILLYHLSKCPPHPDIPDSPENNQLTEELDKMNEQRARYMKDEDYDGIRSMYTKDAMYYSDKMRPGIGIEGRIHVSLFVSLQNHSGANNYDN